ncbi:MAG: glycosyltransferase family 9 protein [Proteobacteria bacterium]|nr:glycosyltransferase family 9 protein [Pseudomonadota bacterium]
MIRLGALGDVLRTLPAVSALRQHYTDARLEWLVESGSEGALRDQPWLDDVIRFPREELARGLARPVSAWSAGSAFARELRRRDFDLVLDFHGILKSGVLAWWTRAAVRVGYAPPLGRESGHRFLNRRARLAAAPVSRFERNDALVRFLGIETPASPRPFRVSPEDRAWAETQTRGAASPVLIHPGTSPGTVYKRYPPARYAEVIRALAARDGADAWVAFGPSAEERASARAVVEAARGAARLAPETRSIGRLAALCEQARVFVGSDSGPLHLASLVGTPVVQLLGPTHPVHNQPYTGTPWRRVHVPQSCSPCRRGCASVACMQALTPDAIVSAVRELLASSAFATGASPSEGALRTGRPAAR